MAHIEKYTSGAAGRMLKHYERAPVEHRGNENIKPELTQLNYNVAAADQPMPQAAFVAQRLKEVRVQKRADVNTLCDWVITQPQELPADKSRAFFEAAYAFLRDRYGECNVVSAYVHMDEVTPHMHFAFLPIVADQKRGGEKLCAKEVINRKELQMFHTALQNAVERDLGIKVHLLNGATQNGNKSVAELKRATSAEALREKARQDTEIVRKAAERAADVVKTTEKGFGKKRHTEVTIAGQTHQQLLEAASAADRLTRTVKQWERNFATVNLAAERLQGELLEERRRSARLKEQLDIRNERVIKQRTDYEELLEDINAVLDDLPEKVQAKLRVDFSKKRKQRMQQAEERREVSVSKAPDIPKTVAEFAQKHKQPDRSKGRGRSR